MGTVVTFHGKNKNCKQMVTASPRKKILAERNEPVWDSSVSFSDLKSPSLNSTMEDPQHMTPKTQKDIDSKEVFCSKNEPEEEPVCVNASEESDSVNLDPSFSPPLSCPKSSMVIAPFDADPSAQKTSYLLEDISISGSSEDVSYATPSLYGNLGPTVVVELESSEAEQSQNVGAADHIDSKPESKVSMREAIVLISLAEEVNTLLSGVQELQHESEMSSAGAEVESFKDHSPMSSEVDASFEDVSYARPSVYGNLGPTAIVELESSEAEQSQNVGATDHIDSEPESNASMREAIIFISPAEEVNTLLSGVQELQHEFEMSSTGAEVESFEDHSPISSKVDASYENLQIPSSEAVITPEEVELTVDETESQVSTVTFLGIASLVYGSTAFIYGNKRKSTASNPAISVVQPSLMFSRYPSCAIPDLDLRIIWQIRDPRG